MMMLSQAASMIGAELIGNDAMFSRVSKDTRTIEEGDLYVAIEGERFDGHDFISQAGESGAVGALTSKDIDASIPCIRVDDTLSALGDLARAWRARYKGFVIGLTGSNGKTTVKEMCHHIIASVIGGSGVHATTGNLNNDIGMPLTVLGLRDQHRFAVIEMGANHVGEIAYLTAIARPHVAILNNVGPAHLEGFGSLENTADAKAEIFGGLVTEGTAVINLDDAFAPRWLDTCSSMNRMTFSHRYSDADVFLDDDDCVHHRGERCTLKLQVPGDHNQMNALAATAACLAAGFRLDQIIGALNDFSNIGGRLAARALGDGVQLFDDTYNANPESVRAGIDVLASHEAERFLVLGDMGELGEHAETMHREIGEYARSKGVEHLYATGELSRATVDGFGDGGRWFQDHVSLSDELDEVLRPGAVVLVKGSRYMKMEKVVERLVEQYEHETKVN